VKVFGGISLVTERVLIHVFSEWSGSGEFSFASL